MKGIKKFGIFILVLISFQTISFYAVSNSLIVKQIGENYESFVIDHAENDFIILGFVSGLNPGTEQIKQCFPKFESYQIVGCTTLADCSSIRENDNFYIYGFDFNSRNPFVTHKIIEFEFAKEFGAIWESKYIWVFYRWVLLEKINTGIS